MTSRPQPGPAPSDHARRSASPTTASSWRTWPKVKARTKLPTVEGAITRNANTFSAAAQHVGVVDVGTAGHNGVHHRHHLAPRPRTAHSSRQTDHRVDQRFELEANGQRGDQQQPGVGNQVGVIEAHPDPVDGMRYSTH